jgi:hypothetical protein
VALDTLCAARRASAGAVLIQRVASRRAIDLIARSEMASTPSWKLSPPAGVTGITPSRMMWQSSIIHR